MRILSVHHSFSADHSSSTYEFFALQPLTREQRAVIQSLTGEAGRRHLSFTYHGDWSDLPSAWPDKLLTSGYDILVSESYDWWGVHLALPRDADLFERLAAYECESDSNGLGIRALGERMVLYFGMSLDYGAAYSVFGEEVFEGLADLFERVREELLAGDLSAAWAIYSTYGYGDEEGPEPVEPLSSSGQTLLGIMEQH